MSSGKRSIAAVAALFFLLGAVFVLAPRRGAPAIYPNPNGYDSLMRAAELGNEPAADYYATTNVGELEVILLQEQERLRLVRLGLSQECRARVTNSTVFARGHVEQLGRVKRLAHLLAAEGRLAEEKGRPGEAARSYLDAVKLGQEAGRGGLMIDALVGYAVEAIGLKKLDEVKMKLSATEAREVAAALEKLDGKAESSESILKTELEWSRQSGGWRGDLLRLLKPGMLKGAQAKFAQKEQVIQGQRRSTMAALAARAYQLDKGTNASGYGDIVPAYLKTIPKDPTTGGAMAFKW